MITVFQVAVSKHYKGYHINITIYQMFFIIYKGQIFFYVRI